MMGSERDSRDNVSPGEANRDKPLKETGKLAPYQSGGKKC